MKRIITLTILLISILPFTSQAQETYGKSLNIGLGAGGYAGYYKYVNRTRPVFYIDYEFDVAKSFTLAPFVSFYSYSNEYYWGNGNNPQNYRYHETVIPIGVKGSYYFDTLLNAHSDWDFYLAGSLGFAIVNASWEAGYDGDKNYYHDNNSLFLNIHIGAEYHISKKVGVFLDVSSGVSTLGLAFHGIK
ncbi:MAG: hypothetical protein ABL895_13950 [Cyclobacteriaceae bacterium]